MSVPVLFLAEILVLVVLSVEGTGEAKDQCCNYTGSFHTNQVKVIPCMVHVIVPYRPMNENYKAPYKRFPGKDHQGGGQDSEKNSSMYLLKDRA